MLYEFACEMGTWSSSPTGGFPPGTPVTSHTKTNRTQPSVPISMINIRCMYLFRNSCKIIKVFFFYHIHAMLNLFVSTGR